ncbi:protein SNORC [Anableps anableps]
MVHSSICRVILVFFSLLLVLAHTETVLDPTLTIRDHQDAMSGEPPSEVTTKNPFLDSPGQTYTFDFEDSTHAPILDEDEGVLGPGAITAIVIAVFLGASVLLALIVITIRKFTTS